MFGEDLGALKHLFFSYWFLERMIPPTIRRGRMHRYSKALPEQQCGRGVGL
jgi:hypothetical protein